MDDREHDGAERRRMEDIGRGVPWRRWGPYVSERQWGSVREDYTPGGDAWGYLGHDQARSYAYRWGEDGIAGISDDEQRLCLAVTLWNGRDPILKERLFGLTNAEGNHGEDVKEYYFHVDNTPSHAYMEFRYKYPQAEFPYLDLVRVNRARSRQEFEYELLDTGVFDGSRYFDVVVEYAKQEPDDLMLRVTAHNRGPRDAVLHVLPTLWFRNTWRAAPEAGGPRPQLREVSDGGGSAVLADHPTLGRYLLRCEGDVPLLFTENETNHERLGGPRGDSRYFKDGVDRAVVHGETGAVNPEGRGTKVAAHHVLTVPAGGSRSVRVRLAADDGQHRPSPTPAGADRLFAGRRAESDAFYRDVLADGMDPADHEIARRALAGMLWSKQYYEYDVQRWQEGHGARGREDAPARNRDWRHLRAADVISMPDTWEYPWFAAWDLAFHCVPLSLVDGDFAKQQLDLLLTRRYLHPNGQLPAYEWNFSDVNPPVHAWATWFVYEHERRRTGSSDRPWLERSFQRLLRNFMWWVNRKDTSGRNVFQGGFLGLDNIGVFDRSAPLPTGGYLDQADGTAWMALYCQNMLQIALELAEQDPVYAEQAAAFLEHFGRIALAVQGADGNGSMWDEQDGFFYDLLRLPDGTSTRLRVRSLVGLLPLAATTVLSPELTARYPELVADVADFVRRNPAVSSLLSSRRSTGGGQGHLLAMFDEGRLRRILARMLDEAEFLGPHGIRSVSKAHQAEPYQFRADGQLYEVRYAPAESDSGMFGGNSNWRGPVWFPVNALLIRALLNLYAFYGDDFRVECPTGSGHELTLYEVAREISDRLTAAFRRGTDGRRPVYGGLRPFQEDPHWRDLLMFPEYLHGDDGAGLGATHQTGWTAAAVFPHLFATVPAQELRLGVLRGGWSSGGRTPPQWPGHEQEAPR